MALKIVPCAETGEFVEQQREIQTTFMIGDKVVYPPQGPCRVGAIVKRTIAGEHARFYSLSLLDNSGDAVLMAFLALRRVAVPTVETFEVVDSTLHGVAPSAA